MLNVFNNPFDILVVPDNKDKPCKNLCAQIKCSKVKIMIQMKKTVKVGKKEIKINLEIMYLRLLAVNARKQVQQSL